MRKYGNNADDLFFALVNTLKDKKDMVGEEPEHEIGIDLPDKEIDE